MMLSALIAALFGSCTAQGTLVLEGYLLNGQTDSGRPAMASLQLTGGSFPTFFAPYGCWCNFDNFEFSRSAPGRGAPVDQWDAICRKLQLAYKCAIMDHGQSCAPWAREYPIIGADKTEEEVKSACEALFPADQCATDACVIENQFLNEVSALSDSGMTQVDEFKHANGFNQETSCIATPAASTGNECCGAFPSRFPFNPNMRKCCADGSIQAFGKCL